MNTDNSIFEETECELDCENLTEGEAEEYFEQESHSIKEALADAFTPEEIEEIYYDKPKKIPFSQLSKSQKGVPLESVIRRYCNSTRFKYDIPFKDLAKNKNHKKSKRILDVDFVINDFAAIEAKNWNCLGGKQYVVTKRDLNNQVLNKFAKYSSLKKILIIANPWWERGAIKYLMDSRVEVIQLGFQVTFETKVMESAFWKIKPELDTLLYIPYLQFQRMVLTI